MPLAVPDLSLGSTDLRDAPSSGLPPPSFPVTTHATIFSATLGPGDQLAPCFQPGSGLPVTPELPDSPESFPGTTTRCTRTAAPYSRVFGPPSAARPGLRTAGASSPGWPGRNPTAPAAPQRADPEGVRKPLLPEPRGPEAWTPWERLRPRRSARGAPRAARAGPGPPAHAHGSPLPARPRAWARGPAPGAPQARRGSRQPLGAPRASARVRASA